MLERGANRREDCHCRLGRGTGASCGHHRCPHGGAFCSQVCAYFSLTRNAHTPTRSHAHALTTSHAQMRRRPRCCASAYDHCEGFAAQVSVTAPPRRQVNATSTLRRNLNPSVISSAFRRNLNPSVVSAHVVVVVVEPYAQQRAHDATSALLSFFAGRECCGGNLCALNPFVAVQVAETA